MNERIREFWGQFGIEGDSLKNILRKLKNPEIKNLSNKEKISFIKKIYMEKLNKDKEIFNVKQKIYNTAILKLRVENSKLMKRKTEEKLFDCEDKIQKYEDIIEPIKKEILLLSNSINKNQSIVNKLNDFLLK